MNIQKLCIDHLLRVLLCVHVSVLSTVAQNFTSFAGDLQKPTRLIFTPQGNLLVSEGGLPEPQTGRVSIIDRSGNRRSLLEGLPNARGYTLNPYGPTGLALDGDTLYLLIGEGDVLAFPPPNLRLNPDGPSSPIFSTILKIQFSLDVDRLRGTFRLRPPDDWALFDGYAVQLENPAGERASVQLLTAFRPIVRNVLAPGPLTVRQSNPYAVALDARNRALWVTDAASETVIKVDTDTGRSRVVFRFEPVLRATATGRVPVDNVPAGICLQGDQLLVSTFTTAAPQAVGEAAVWSIDTHSGATRQVATNLTAIGDILCGTDGSYVLENFLYETPPRTSLSVLQGDGKRTLADVPANSTANVIAGGMARDPVSGAIYVARTGVVLPGDIVRVSTR